MCNIYFYHFWSLYFCLSSIDLWLLNCWFCIFKPFMVCLYWLHDRLYMWMAYYSFHDRFLRFFRRSFGLNGPSDYWTFGLSGILTIGAFGRSGIWTIRFRTIGHSYYSAFGLSGPHRSWISRNSWLQRTYSFILVHLNVMMVLVFVFDVWMYYSY